MRFRPLIWIIIASSLWAGWFIITTWFRHQNLLSSHFDLGIMDQVLWQTIHGQVFAMTSPTLGILQSRFAIHADPLLLIYTPLYALWQDPRTLITLQTLAVASGAWPLWWLARRQLSTHWALIPPTLYLVQPVLHWSILFDVHAVVLATPLLLWAVWAATNKRFLLMVLFFGLALLAKEEVGLVVSLSAAVLAWKKILTPRIAWIVGSSALVWVAIVTSVLLPHFAANSSHFAIHYFSEYGTSVPSVILGLLQHPVIFLNDLMNRTSAGYILIVLGSVALLPLRRPLWLLPAVPILVMNLISNDHNMQSIFYQYTATITPFILLATVDGLSALQHLPRLRLVIWITVWVGVMTWLWAPLPGTRHHRDAIRVFITNPYGPQLRQVAAAIPPEVHLTVSNDLGPHFSRRDRIWVFPFVIDQADAAVILLNRERDVLPQAELRSALTKLQLDPNWETVASWNDELFYLRKKN